jgi:hypothetical protein
MTDAARNGNGTDFTALLEFLADTPDKLASFTAGLSGSEIRLQNSPDEFSVVENICHLRDLELQGYAPRIRRILAETNPALADFDGARVAAESDYNREQPHVALQKFQIARGDNVELLRAATEEQLEREGTLAGVGIITLKRLAELMREHDEGHLTDLKIIRRRIEKCRELTR